MLKYEGNSESKVTIDFVLIGTPAWNSKKIHKGDVLVAVDGNEEKGEAMIAKLLGAHGTSVILTIKKEGGDEPVDVELQRMATSLVADKRKMFDLFTAIEHRFLMDKDMIGKKYNDDALAFWTQMCMEEIDQDKRYVCVVFLGHPLAHYSIRSSFFVSFDYFLWSKHNTHRCRANVEVMHTETNIWLSECDAILAQLLAESEHEKPVVAEGRGSGARPVRSAPRANGGDEASLKEVSIFVLFA